MELFGRLFACKRIVLVVVAETSKNIDRDRLDHPQYNKLYLWRKLDNITVDLLKNGNLRTLKIVLVDDHCGQLKRI